MNWEHAFNSGLAYRETASTLLGAACPPGIAKPDISLLEAVTAEWLAEFERIQLMLRLSQRLRAQHGDWAEDSSQ